MDFKDQLSKYFNSFYDYVIIQNNVHIMFNVFMIIVFALVARIIQKRVFSKVSSLHGKKKKSDMWRVAVVDSGDKPVSYLILFLGLNYAISMLRNELDTGSIFIWQDHAEKVALIGLMSWFLVRFINRMEQLFVDPDWGGSKDNKTTAMAVGRVLKIALVITTVLLILQSLNIPINGVLALGSAGTIVVGIAAKDLLANFFGGMVIFMDSPFKVGDWISSPDKNIQGTVEHIGWRLTRIRTFSQRPLYVPNSVFLTISIENPQRMLNRQIKMTFGLRYQDFDKVGKVTEKIEAMLKSHPEIDLNRTTFVAFNNFGPSSLDCLVYCFTKTRVWVPYLKIQQEVFVKIAEIVKECGADMAFPTTTIDLPSDADVPEWVQRSIKES